MAALVLWRSAYSRVRASSRSTLARCSPRFVAWREFTMDSHALAPLFVRVPLRAATMAVIMAAIDDGSMSRRKLHVSCWLCLLQQQASPCRCACLYGIVYLNCPPTPQTLTAATCTVVLDRKLRASSGACICETTLCVSCLVHTTVPYCPRRYQPVSLLESRLNLSRTSQPTRFTFKRCRIGRRQERRFEHQGRFHPQIGWSPSSLLSRPRPWH